MTEPELKCQLYKYEVPEVMCEDQTRRQCTDLAHLQPDTVSLHLDTAAPDYQGHCQPRSLALSQQVTCFFGPLIQFWIGISSSKFMDLYFVFRSVKFSPNRHIQPSSEWIFSIFIYLFSS